MILLHSLWLVPIGRVVNPGQAGGEHTKACDRVCFLHLILAVDGVGAPVCYGHTPHVPRSDVDNVILVRENGMRVPEKIEKSIRGTSSTYRRTLRENTALKSLLKRLWRRQS